MAAISTFAAAPCAYSCPGAVFVGELPSPPLGPRQGLRLFAQDTGGAWRHVALQVDPVDGDGHLVFYTDNQYLSQNVDHYDYLTFRHEDFGQRWQGKKTLLPCRGAAVVELRDDVSQRYGYLTNCGKEAPAFTPSMAVQFQHGEHKLTSQNYEYSFDPNNYMQFGSIKLRNARGLWDLMAMDSRMLIRADVKRFFTMSFDHRHIVSELENSRLGPVGNMARLSFFLRILMFHIRMSLSTDVGFYDDSGHIPMMINIPVNAYDYLNPASGILYSWIMAPLAADATPQLHMPVLDPTLVQQGYKELGKLGTKYCVGDTCSFGYAVDAHGQRLAMDLSIKRDLVERGFFPLFVADVGKRRDAMGWDVDMPPGTQRLGMYFEVSGLGEGGHPWDFWLRMASAADGAVAASTCPAPLHMELVH